MSIRIIDLAIIFTSLIVLGSLYYTYKQHKEMKKIETELDKTINELENDIMTAEENQDKSF